MKNKLVLTVALFLVLGLSSVFAQEWSAAQKEVWKNVNTYWGIMANGDVGGFLNYFDADYVGWDNGDVLPSNKEVTKKWVEFAYQGVKVPVYDIKPVAIKIHGEFAFVDYYYAMVKESKDGKKISENGRWTDILMKKGDKWVIIGDHGGKDK